MYRIMWFTDKQDAVDLAKRMAKDNGCTARKEGCTWEAYNPACPEANAVVVQKALQDPRRKGGPEGYEVAVRCNMYGEQEKWPTWLSDRGITPGKKYPIGGLILSAAGEVVVAGGVTNYQLPEASLRKVRDAYGPPVPRRVAKPA
ncbi:MAG: hypothetical protein ACUVSK_13385 [Desulfotomaculales bacterium]